jgi:plastocyanin
MLRWSALFAVAVVITRGSALSTPIAPAATIEIKTFQFSPDTLRVQAGTRVAFANLDDIEHTVTSGSPEQRDKTFNAVLAKKGSTFAIDLKEPGSYRYFCDRHQFMRATILVTK